MQMCVCVCVYVRGGVWVCARVRARRERARASVCVEEFLSFVMTKMEMAFEKLVCCLTV